MVDRILRFREVIHRCGVSRATIYRRMAEGDFPRPLRLGGSAVGWRESDIDAWIADRPEATIGPAARRPRRRPVA